MGLKISPYKQRRIRQLERDITKIESYYYSFVERFGNDPDAKIYALKLKKALLVRSLILETHLAIEDFLDLLIKKTVLRTNPRVKKRAARRASIYFSKLFDDAETFLSGNTSIGFKRKIILLRMTGIIGKKLYKDLDLLNSLRNKCSHYWILDSVIRRKIKRKQPKKILLAYRGKNLFNSDTLIEFLRKYNDVFLKITNKI